MYYGKQGVVCQNIIVFIPWLFITGGVNKFVVMNRVFF